MRGAKNVGQVGSCYTESPEYHEIKTKFEREIMDLSQEQNNFNSTPITFDKIIETCKNVILNLDIAIFGRVLLSVLNQIIIDFLSSANLCLVSLEPQLQFDH